MLHHHGRSAVGRRHHSHYRTSVDCRHSRPLGAAHLYAFSRQRSRSCRRAHRRRENHTLGGDRRKHTEIETLLRLIAAHKLPLGLSGGKKRILDSHHLGDCRVSGGDIAIDDGGYIGYICGIERGRLLKRVELHRGRYIISPEVALERSRQELSDRGICYYYPQQSRSTGYYGGGNGKHPCAGHAQGPNAVEGVFLYKIEAITWRVLIFRLMSPYSVFEFHGTKLQK